jgi:hypothetical protein
MTTWPIAGSLSFVIRKAGPETLIAANNFPE